VSTFVLHSVKILLITHGTNNSVLRYTKLSQTDADRTGYHNLQTDCPMIKKFNLQWTVLFVPLI
jgi:hypothetical protein